jgi:hypothetical protein
MWLILLLPLAACSGGGGYVPEGCEPGSGVRATIGGQVAAGGGDEGFVTDRDLDITIAVTPEGPGCR